MNERIKELIKQCTSQSEGSTWTSREEFDKEKFAELIVRHAADMFEVEYGSSEGLSGNRVAAVLKEHFGVEE